MSAQIELTATYHKLYSLSLTRLLALQDAMQQHLAALQDIEAYPAPNGAALTREQRIDIKTCTYRLAKIEHRIADLEATALRANKAATNKAKTRATKKVLEILTAATAPTSKPSSSSIMTEDGTLLHGIAAASYNREKHRAKLEATANKFSAPQLHGVAAEHKAYKEMQTYTENTNKSEEVANKRRIMEAIAATASPGAATAAATSVLLDPKAAHDKIMQQLGLTATKETTKETEADTTNEL